MFLQNSVRVVVINNIMLMIRRLHKFTVGLAVFFSLVSNAFSQEPVLVQVHYGPNDANECSWEIINKLDNSVVLSGGPGPSGGIPYFSYDQTINFIPGEYLFKAYDSYGDGWPLYDGWFQVVPSVGIGTGLIDSITGYLYEADFTVFSSADVDMGMVSWNFPNSSPGLSNAENIGIIIRNYGQTALNSFNLFYSIDGGNSYITEPFNNILLPGDTIEFIFSQTADLASPGSYNCIAGVSAPFDVMQSNDTVYSEVISYASISSYPWEETFSVWPPAGWSFSGTTNWLSYANTAAYCNFFYWNSDTAEMISPPLNVSAPASLSFDWSSGLDQYSLNDELKVLISTDFGQTWTLVWDKVGIYLNSYDGANYTSPGAYVGETVDITQFANNIIYIKFIGSTESGYNLYVDNVTVALNPSNDLSIINWQYPTEAGCNLSSNENITIQVKNTGSTNISNFTLAYSITGTPSYQMENVATTIFPGDTLDYTFSTTADFSAFGDYNCQALLINPGDVVSTNNLLDNVIVKNLNTINSFPFFENFETGNSEYFKLNSEFYSNASFNYSNSNYAIKMEGGPTNYVGWIGGPINTTPINAWNTNYAYKSSAYTCTVDATSLSTIEMYLDLKQYYWQGPKYSWFRVLVNGAQIPDDNGVLDFHPLTQENDTFVTHRFDLSFFAGTQFVITLESSNKYSSYTNPPGNVSFVDNILIQEIPLPDAAVVNLLSPESNCSLSASEALTVQIQNNGGFEISNYDISYSIDGGPFVLNNVTSAIPAGGTLDYSFTQTEDFSNIGQYQVTVAVSYAGDSNSANDTMMFVVEHLTPSPVYILGLDSSYCLYDTPVLLTGNPTGGTFSGDGVSSDIFDPFDAGVGTHDIIYTHYDTTTGCYNTITETVIVGGTDVSFSGLYTGPTQVPVLVEVFYNSPWYYEQSWEIINENGIVVLSSPAGTANGYSYNGTINLPFGNYTFVAHDVYGDGWHNSWYNITPDFGTGTGIQTYDIPLQQQPMYSQSSNFIVGGTVYVCTGDSPIVLTGDPAGGVFSGAGITGNVFDPASAGTGTFSLVYTYTDGTCVGTDTQMVIVNETTVIDLGADQFACDGETIVLHAGLDFIYEWNTGATDSTINVNTSGLYSVTITSQNGCESSSDVNIVFNPLPGVDLGQDQNLCMGDTLILDAGIGDTYFWNDGTTLSTLETTISGLYSVTVTSADGCVKDDDIIVTFHEVNLDLGSDTGFCDGSSTIIDPGVYSSYLWSTGSTDQLLDVSLPDTYILTVSNVFGCTAEDTINVEMYSLPFVDLGPDVLIDDTMIILDAGIGFSSILWSNGLNSQVYPVFSDSMPSGDNIIWVEVTDVNQCSYVDTIIITVELSSQIVALPNGWSIMSTFILPTDPLLDNVFSPIISNVLMIKNGGGEVYWPFWGVNTIGNMVIGEGYQISMLSADTIEILGDQALPDTTAINIPTGWSIIGYLRTSPMVVPTAVNSIVSNIVMMKDGDGNVYWTTWGYNGIGDMIPGRGYQILLINPSVLFYPANGPSQSFKKEIRKPEYFTNITNTGNNMTLVIPKDAWEIVPNIGDEIAVYSSDDILVGSGVYNNTNTFITIWGNDTYSNRKDGLYNKEKFKLRLWNKSNNISSDIVIFNIIEGDEFYKSDTYSIVGSLKTVLGNQPELYQNYPNPFTDKTTIGFYLPKSNNISIMLYNALGEKVRTLANGNYAQGTHKLVISGDDISTGIYYYKLKTEKFEIVKQLCIK